MLCGGSYRHLKNTRLKGISYDRDLDLDLKVYTDTEYSRREEDGSASDMAVMRGLPFLGFR